MLVVGDVVMVLVAVVVCDAVALVVDVCDVVAEVVAELGQTFLPWWCVLW